MNIQLSHDDRSESAYTMGRQPFSYKRIIDWAKANGWSYSFVRFDPKMESIGKEGNHDYIMLIVWPTFQGDMKNGRPMRGHKVNKKITA